MRGSDGEGEGIKEAAHATTSLSLRGLPFPLRALKGGREEEVEEEGFDIEHLKDNASSVRSAVWVGAQWGSCCGGNSCEVASDALGFGGSARLWVTRLAFINLGVFWARQACLKNEGACAARSESAVCVVARFSRQSSCQRQYCIAEC